MKNIVISLLIILSFSFKTNNYLLPVANAGSDKFVISPATTTSLDGTGSTGTSLTYYWSKITGPSGGAISSPNSSTTNLSSLVEGVYSYELVAVDNVPSMDGDTVFVFVLPSNTVSYSSSMWIVYQNSDGVGVINYAKLVNNSKGQIIKYLTSDGQILTPSSTIKQF